MAYTSMEMARLIAERVAAAGGTVYYVGGYVRDRILRRENKDIDIEVHGVTPSVLESILDLLGDRITIGESFGIYNLKGYSLDIAMPRKENNRGTGHRDFDICVDPFIGTYGAAKRRDFTVNALLENVLTGEIVDHFGGLSDIEHGVLRHVNDATFAEDPLRVLRAAQFAARFGYTIAEDTMALCGTMDLTALSRERVMAELEKALLKSDKPSVFFETLRAMSQLSYWFSELEHTIQVEQNPKHHAEGNVWVHTMMVLDVAVRYRDKVKNPLGFMLSAVTHDFGKAICTAIVKGEIHAYGHEIEGLPLVQTFMARLTSNAALTEYVMNLTEWHMEPNTLAAVNAKIKSTNKLFDRSVDPAALVYLATADGLGRFCDRTYISYDDFLAKRLAVYEEYMARPYVMGRDLIAAGLTPSEKFADYLAFAHKLRLVGIDKTSALKQTLGYAAAQKDYRTIFVVDGEAMAEQTRAMRPEAVVIPFLDDLTSGPKTESALDDTFICARADYLHITEEEYRTRMDPLLHFESRRSYVLCFGDDPRGIADLACVIAYFRAKGYTKDLTVRIMDRSDLSVRKEYVDKP